MVYERTFVCQGDTSFVSQICWKKELKPVLLRHRSRWRHGRVGGHCWRPGSRCHTTPCFRLGPRTEKPPRFDDIPQLTLDRRSLPLQSIALAGRRSLSQRLLAKYQPGRHCECEEVPNHASLIGHPIVLNTLSVKFLRVNRVRVVYDSNCNGPAFPSILFFNCAYVWPHKSNFSSCSGP